MTDSERYGDPALARRVRAWAKEAAPTTAPERLVHAVMDEVERERPRRRSVLGPIRLQTFWQYVALTLVIAIGVAVGTWATRQESVATNPPAPSAPPPTGQPSSTATTPPSLPTIGRYDFPGAPGPSAIGVSGASLWVGTPDGSVVELDSSSGDRLGEVGVGVEPITITPVGGRLWIGSGGDDLIRVDPDTHAVATIAGAGGHYVLAWGGSLWVSRQEQFLQVDPSTGRVVGTLPAPGHAAHQPGLIVGDELWTGVGDQVVRLALPSGTIRGTFSVNASALIATRDGVLAIDGGVLLRVTTSEGPLGGPTTIVRGLPEPVGEAVAGDRVWVTGAGPDRAGEVVEIDLTAGRIASRTPVGGGTRAIAVIDRSVWVAVDTGALLQLGR